MADQRYEYQRVNAIKIIIEKDGKLLLIREPLTNDWMPGHWGLPGGKPVSEESLIKAYERKVKSDLGIDLELQGLYKIVELLIENRTVLMFIVVAKYIDGNITGEVNEYKWIGEEELKSMDVSEFTEYYNKELLLSYFESGKEVVSVNLIRSYEYFRIGDEPDYKRWKDSGVKK